MVVSLSDDITQTGNGRKSTPILPLFHSTCGRWLRVCQLTSHEQKWRSTHTHPSTNSHHLRETVAGPPADLTLVTVTLTGSGRRSSTILPPMPTITTLVEGGHGLIGGPCLELHEVGFAATTLVIGTGG